MHPCLLIQGWVTRMNYLDTGGYIYVMIVDIDVHFYHFLNSMLSIDVR